jgi:hypothetical protein
MRRRQILLLLLHRFPDRQPTHELVSPSSSSPPLTSCRSIPLIFESLAGPTWANALWYASDQCDPLRDLGALRHGQHNANNKGEQRKCGLLEVSPSQLSIDDSDLNLKNHFVVANIIFKAYNWCVLAILWTFSFLILNVFSSLGF